MKSFSEYIIHSSQIISEGLIPKEEFNHTASNKLGKQRNMYRHSTYIDGHSIEANFYEHDSHPGVYSTSIFVNDHVSKRMNNLHPSIANKISQHFASVVQSFIHHHKPQGISFSAEDSNSHVRSKKENSYSKILHRMGAKSVFSHDRSKYLNGDKNTAHFESHEGKMNESATTLVRKSIVAARKIFQPKKRR